MANASAPPVLFGSAGRPLRFTGKQGYRSQGVRSQNRSNLDEFYFRNAGLNSDEARKAAMDIYGTGMQMTRGGLEQSSIFNRPRSTASQPTQTPLPPRERFREKGTVASAAGIDPENLRDMAKVEPFKPAPKPQIMPATASDAASGRVDTMGPGGSPSQITSKYGTASITTGPRKGKAMTRDTFAGRNIPLKEWLRQRRAAQAERGIA